MKSTEFIIEAVNKRSYNKQIIDALKVHGFKVEDREQSGGALKTWLKVDNPMTLQDIVAEIAPKFPGTKVEDWDGDMEAEIRGPGFQIEKQGRGSIFLAVYAGPKAEEYSMGLDEDDNLSSSGRRRARQKREAKADQFAWFRFEDVDTMKLYNHLESEGYDVVGANHHEILIDSLNKKLADEIQNIIWDHNGGAWCEYKFVTYDEIKHLL